VVRLTPAGHPIGARVPRVRPRSHPPPAIRSTPEEPSHDVVVHPGPAPAQRRGPRTARRLLARGQLPVRRADLPAGQPAAARTAAGRARQAAAAGALGHDARAEPDLRAHEPADPGARPERALHHRARARRTRAGGQRLPGGHLQRGLLRHHRGRRRDARAVPAVLLPRRHPQPRRPGDARLDPRGRRARLRPGARLRRRLRQPGPDGRLRDRRRRGGDRPAGGQLALQQVPRPGPRRRRAAGAAPERLEDRQPDGAGPDPGRRAGRAHARLRPHPALRDRRRPDRPCTRSWPPPWT
jgi:hypothetical protein